MRLILVAATVLQLGSTVLEQGTNAEAPDNYAVPLMLPLALYWLLIRLASSA